MSNNGGGGEGGGDVGISGQFPYYTPGAIFLMPEER